MQSISKESLTLFYKLFIHHNKYDKLKSGDQIWNNKSRFTFFGIGCPWEENL